MTILNTSDREERGRNEQETSVISSHKNAGEAGLVIPNLSNIECTNPYCQMCHGIGDKDGT